jgi:ribonuclease J
MNTKNRLIFLPLGGAGEIGMNMYLYGYGPKGRERFILVDVGVTFPDMESTPGVDLIMADPGFIEARADRLEAIFITHAHEDHIGAIGHLFSRLQAPIYTRAFTAAIARAKMEDHGQSLEHIREVGAWPQQIKAGPFTVAFLPVAHSIPEASGLIIDTKAGRIVHTGDLKLDPDPIVGDPYDPVMFREIAKGGIQALVCDSTNVFSPLPGRSESELIGDITGLIKGASGMMVATTFASNVARLKTLAQAGVDAGRSVVVLGRAMQRMLAAAHATGVLDNFPPTIDVEDARDIPRDHLMLLVTGSQGERRAASAQLARGKYLGITLKDGDTFLFSSKTIPGNEVGVARIVNQLSTLGVQVIDDTSGFYHVSGHANRPDLEAVHALLKPKMLIPMHGEHRHLRAHADLAGARGIPSVIAPNGAVVDLTGDAPEVVDQVETGRLYLDGKQLIGAYDGVVLERIRMATRGTVAVSVILDGPDMVGGAWTELLGLPETALPQADLVQTVEENIDAELAKARAAILASDEQVESLIRRVVSRTCSDLIGKKPVTSVMINRLVDS